MRRTTSQQLTASRRACEKARALGEFEVVCLDCGEPANLQLVDFGIGPYEFWGRTGWDRDIQLATDCCESMQYE